MTRSTLALTVLVLLAATTSPAAIPCEDGFAGPYPCDGVDLLAHVPLTALGATRANDCWGWWDPVTGREYALVGLYAGTAFVDVTDPENPVLVGSLPSHTGGSTWRDVKTYADHAYIVSDGNGSHGLQIFDLTLLRDVASPPTTFAETAHFDGFGSAHNIVINEDSGFAFVVGSAQASGGLYFLDLQDPLAPVPAGGFSADGYTHDAQCVIYQGPDPDYQGREICLACNEDTITIVDVTNKFAPVEIARADYPDLGYVHQGWLTEDQRYFLQSDETDEWEYGHNTRTHLWDVSDLDQPQYLGYHTAATAAIDHNQYVKGNRVYQANYRAGLRVLDLARVGDAELVEIGFFDIYPDDDIADFDGAWSTYPYLPSGNIIVSGIDEGLFVLSDPGDLTAADSPPSAVLALEPPTPNPFNPATRLRFTLARGGYVRLTVHDLAGRRVATLVDGRREAGNHEVIWRGRDERGRAATSGAYLVRLESAGVVVMQKALLLK